MCHSIRGGRKPMQENEESRIRPQNRQGLRIYDKDDGWNW